MGEPAVLWEVVPSGWANVKDAVRLAGLDPDDQDIKVGILEVDWKDHPAGALVISSRARQMGRPFLISRESLVM